MIERSYLKGLNFGLNCWNVQFIHFLINIVCRPYFCNLFLGPGLALQILSELNDWLLLLPVRQVFLFNFLDEIFSWSGWPLKSWVLIFLPEFFQIVNVLSLVGLFAHKDLVFRRAFNLFLEFLGILFGEFKVLHSLHFLVNIVGSNERRALDPFLDFFLFLRINFRFKTDFYFFCILFAFFL